MGYDELENKRFEGQLLLIGLVLGGFGNIVAEDLKNFVGLEKTGFFALVLHIIAWGTLFGAVIIIRFEIGEYLKTLWQRLRQPKKRKGSRIHRSGFIFRLRNYLRY